MLCRYCTCATFRDRKGARWLTPQLLPSAPPVKQRLVQLQGTKNVRYDITNESSTIKFVGNYFCHRFLSTMSINRCTPTVEFGCSPSVLWIFCRFLSLSKDGQIEIKLTVGVNVNGCLYPASCPMSAGKELYQFKLLLLLLCKRD